jgi:hypothetical protein
VTPPGCIRRVPCPVNTRTYSRFGSTVPACGKAGGEDPGGLGVQELPPGRAAAAWRRIDARGSQDLTGGGWRDRSAGFGQFAVDSAASPQRVLLGHADREAGNAADCRRTAGLAPAAGVVFSDGQLAVPGQQRCWCHGKT